MKETRRQVVFKASGKEITIRTQDYNPALHVSCPPREKERGKVSGKRTSKRMKKRGG